MTIVKINSANLTEASQQAFNEAFAPQGELLREVALELIPMIHDRIHVQGLAADGSLIGTYSDAYMRTRTGTFKNAETFKKGKNAGKPKNAGTATKGASQGTARQRFNRSGDTKVILSLTRQMENDYAVVPGDVGWGVGFNNSHNFDKANWNNLRYGKVVYDLTQTEQDRFVELTEQLITERFK